MRVSFLYKTITQVVDFYKTKVYHFQRNQSPTQIDKFIFGEQSAIIRSQNYVYTHKMSIVRSKKSVLKNLTCH